MDTSPSSTVELVDKDAYDSRQKYALGSDALIKMARARILIVGAGGLGIEVAKNIVLTGVAQVVLHDESPVSWSDLSSQFFLSESDIGKKRSVATIAKLAELNQRVEVSAHEGELTPDFVCSFHAVVFTDTPLPQLVELNKKCRETVLKNEYPGEKEPVVQHGVRFIAAESRGLCSCTFVDFGKEPFVVSDATGEERDPLVIMGITAEANGVVNVEGRHGLSNGDKVLLSGITGMEGLNGQVREVKVTDTSDFVIGNTIGFGQYVRGGTATVLKHESTFHFKSLEECLATSFPEGVMNIVHFDRPSQMHLGFKALHAYMAKNGGLPKPQDQAAAEEVLKLAKEINEASSEKLDAIDEKVVLSLALGAAGNLSPMNTFLGGVVAQEAIKGVANKFTPIQQFFYFDALECLPEQPVSAEDAAPTGSRYDGQVAVFGKEIQNKLLNLKYFLVGSGALGCEFLKLFAMMGVGCGPEGSVLVTDMDMIETSNLSRQFLFRKQHIGKLKSVVAAAAAKEMNPSFNVTATDKKVAKDTEDIFHEDFWKALSGVCNALDNVEARKYVDSRCVTFKKSLLESGTQGTKANVQVVVPHQTYSYATEPAKDPEDTSYLPCTIKMFPYMIQHTIQWARDKFEEFFKQAALDANGYAAKSDFLDSLPQNIRPLTVKALHEMLVAHRPSSFNDCIAWARQMFEELFVYPAAKLLAFGDLIARERGTPYWEGTKRPPKPLRFDPTDKMHIKFVLAAANLRAFNFGIQGHRDLAEIARVAVSVIVADYEPTVSSTAATSSSSSEKDEKKEAEPSFEDVVPPEVADRLEQEIPKQAQLSGLNLSVAEFEKDDDTNYHIDFIESVSNLRARNYSIAEEGRDKIKLVAGKIIPAIITTTSAVTGLVALELLKLVQGKKLESYRNNFLNLALGSFVAEEPLPCPKDDKGRTLWDETELECPPTATLGEVISHMEAMLSGTVTSVVALGSKILFNMYMHKPDVVAEKKKHTVRALLEQIGVDHAHLKTVNLDVDCDDADGNEMSTPIFRVRI